MKKIMLSDVRNNQNIRVYMERGNDVLRAKGFTEHSFIHSELCAKNAAQILQILGFSEREQELAVISRPSTLTLIEDLQQVVTAEELAELRRTYHEVQVSADVAGYIMDLITATRETGELVGGVSTRGAIALYKAAQVTAAMEGRDYVIPEDVVREAIPVLAHRVTASSGSKMDAENYLIGKIGRTAVPLENSETV